MSFLHVTHLAVYVYNRFCVFTGDCPTGTYYDNNECKLCPPGTYQDTTGKSGAAACVKCPHGTSTKTGGTSISACEGKKTNLFDQLRKIPSSFFSLG